MKETRTDEMSCTVDGFNIHIQRTLFEEAIKPIEAPQMPELPADLVPEKHAEFAAGMMNILGGAMGQQHAYGPDVDYTSSWRLRLEEIATGKVTELTVSGKTMGEFRRIVGALGGLGRDPYNMGAFVGASRLGGA